MAPADPSPADPQDTSWDDLRVLLAVAHAGSLSSAARALGLTQPTVGRRLDRLETALQVPLVRRTSQGCTLTERGAALLPLLERMQEAADGVHRIANSAHHALSGTVRVATGDLVARHLIRRLPELSARAPRLHLEIVTGMSFVRLERGDADLAVRNEAPAGDAWVVHRLGRIRFGVYASPSFLEAHPDVRSSPQARRRSTWVGFARPTSVRSSRWLAAYLGREPDLGFSSSQLILEAVVAGSGMAVLPTYVAEERKLQRIEGPLDDLGFDSFLVIHPSARRLKRVRWVASWLRAVLAHPP